MPLYLSQAQLDQIWAEYEATHPPITTIDGLETIIRVPPLIGSGSYRYIEISEGIDLEILKEVSNEFTLYSPESPHLVQFAAFIQGGWQGEGFGVIDPDRSYIGGGGIQPGHRDSPFRNNIGVNIHFTPQAFCQVFSDASGELPAQLRPLVQGEQPQNRYYPAGNRSIRSVVEQIRTPPVSGSLKRVYWQSKIIELATLQIQNVFECQANGENLGKVKTTIDLLYQAKYILDQRLQSPPLVSELAQQVGISARSLMRRFKQKFGVTIIGYVQSSRMEKAKSLLLEGEMNITRVASEVGYDDPASFTKVFKKYYKFCPRDYLP